MKFYCWEQVDFGKGWLKSNNLDTSTPQEVIEWLVDKCIDLELELERQTQDKKELELTIKHKDYSLDLAKRRIREIGLTPEVTQDTLRKS